MAALEVTHMAHDREDARRSAYHEHQGSRFSEEWQRIGKMRPADWDCLQYEAGSIRRTVQDVIAFNEKHADKELPYFGQDLFLKAEEKGPLTEKAYVDALAKNHQLARTEGIEAIMDKHQLDALVAPTGGPAWLTDLINGDHSAGGSSNAAAVAGYPNINVTAGSIFGLPVGISFFGRAWSEPALIKLAYAFEQTTKARQAPKFLATIS